MALFYHIPWEKFFRYHRGTVKREVAWASLQAITAGFILLPCDLYQWCLQNFTGIKFILVSLEKFEVLGHEPHDRFLRTPKIPATRENHAFIPCARGLQINRISGVWQLIMFPAAAMTTMLQYNRCWILIAMLAAFMMDFGGLDQIILCQKNMITMRLCSCIHMALHDPTDDLVRRISAECRIPMYYVKYRHH